MDIYNEADIITGLKNASAEALEKIYNRYVGKIYNSLEYLYKETLLREEVEVDHSTEEQIEEVWLKKTVDEIIEQMPPDRKRIFKMRRQQEMSTREIANKLDVSVSTVEVKYRWLQSL